MIDYFFILGSMLLVWWSDIIYTNVAIRMSAGNREGAVVAVIISLACILLASVLIYFGIS